MSATCIARVVHGSRLFGTDDHESDIDMKSVWLPSGRDILLGRTDWTEFDSDSSRRNTSDDVDHEQHDLIRYLKLVSAGHPVAIEMLFAPDSAHCEEPHDAWRALTHLAPALIPSSVAKFMGFIEDQATGFGVGERINSVRAAMEALELAKNRTPKATVGDVAQETVDAAASPHVRIDVKPNGSRFLLIAGRSTPFENKASVAHRLAWSLIESFEAKARKLTAGDKRDWRAVSHAIRLAEEALELSTSACLTFPRPNADELIEIKHGRVDAAEVVAKIEHLIPAVAKAARASPLNAVPDAEAADALVVEAYGRQVTLGDRSQDLNLSCAWPTVG
jgi:hypothetical protein